MNITKLKLISSVVMLVLLPALLFAQKYSKTDTGVKFEFPFGNVDMDFYNSSTVKVQKSVKGWKYVKNSLAVISKPQTVSNTITGSGSSYRLSLSELVITVDKLTGAITYAILPGERIF